MVGPTETEGHDVIDLPAWACTLEGACRWAWLNGTELPYYRRIAGIPNGRNAESRQKEASLDVQPTHGLPPSMGRHLLSDMALSPAEALWGQTGNHPYYFWEGEPATLKYYPIEDEE